MCARPWCRRSIGHRDFAWRASLSLLAALSVAAPIFASAPSTADQPSALPGDQETECLLNWAENSYSSLFSPSPAITRFSAPYLYRFYSQTNSYLGVSSVDNHVYYLAPDGHLIDEGSLTAWLPLAGCQPLPTECLFDWAERNYPHLFAPAGATSDSSIYYSYRYYRETDSWLAVSFSDNRVHYMGPDGAMIDEGTLDYWASQAGCIP
jgi:hypothetical protein